MIKRNEEKNLWVLETNKTAYVIGVSETGNINNSYFGERLPYVSDYPDALNAKDESPFTPGLAISKDEYMSWGGIKYMEPCLKATFSDNVRDVKLKYDSYEISENKLTIIMKDIYYPLIVKLYYEVIETLDIIVKSSEIINNGQESITIENALTGSIYLPKEKDYRLTYLVGKWSGETRLKQTILPETKIVLESRRGTTSNYTNPFFAIDKNGLATEEYGEVYFGALAYSGNWKIVIEKSCLNLLKVSAGINDFDFAWNLKPNNNFETPKFVVGYVNEGFGGVSRRLHKYQRECLLPEPNRNDLRKVLYNSWEATTFDVNEEGQSKLAELAASIGVELFVMDDGWFGKRDSDSAGLGDWYVNKAKFPNGLKGLIDKVNTLGMDFGLWVEPEMVNQNSDLYRKRPEWIYHFETRKCSEARNQLVLNLARKDVREYIYNFMDKLLSENNIKFIKWDMNRSFSEPGYKSAKVEEQREIWVKHTRGFYDIVKRLKEKYPKVIFQSCSGGGGRVDLGVLQYFDQVWPSDNTDAYDRLKIQEGFSYIYCAKIMEAWVTMNNHFLNGRKCSLKYRFHSAMAGNLGIGDDLTKWSEDEKKEARELINIYKNIRHIVQNGEQYRLLSPRESNMSSVMYVNEDKSEGILFAFLQGNNFGDDLEQIYPRGLQEDAIYEIEEVATEKDIEKNGRELLINPFKASGKAIMKIGIDLTGKLKGDFESKIIKIKKVNN